jgi:hypothetical protein
MGEIWRGIHPGHGVNVAVKVVTAEFARQEKYRADFRNEVRAVAALDHPGVVMVFDHGLVDRRAEADSDGRLVAGSPYLVMELASGGSLSNTRRRLAWSELRGVLLSLLDALGHAHARGVIHRDLKPANVLVCTADDPRPGLKLTDFGVAHTYEAALAGTARSHMAGTPHFMAPEQVRGAWRDYGPWTDLYALGCLAWRLSAGRPPFAGLRGDDLVVAQVRHRPPPVVARRPVPGGFGDWVACLMEKSRRDRFQCAADAASALVDLGDVFDEGEEGVDDGPAIATSVSVRVEVPTEQSVVGSAAALAMGDPTHNPLAARRARVPPTWRRGTYTPAPLQLRGAGLGLYGVRSIPLVGRRRERDAIWDAMLEVHRTWQPRVVFLTGPAGAGKSRLAQWMGERAHELGAANTLRIGNGPSTAGADALRRCVEVALGCTSLAPHEILPRVRRAIEDLGGSPSPDQVSAIAALLASGTSGGLEAAERHGVLVRLFAMMTRSRPLFLWIDDVEWGSDALSLVSALCERQELYRLPVLIVMTSRDDTTG